MKRSMERLTKSVQRGPGRDLAVSHLLAAITCHAQSHFGDDLPTQFVREVSRSTAPAVLNYRFPQCVCACDSGPRMPQSRRLAAAVAPQGTASDPCWCGVHDWRRRRPARADGAGIARARTSPRVLGAHGTPAPLSTHPFDTLASAPARTLAAQHRAARRRGSPPPHPDVLDLVTARCSGAACRSQDTAVLENCALSDLAWPSICCGTHKGLGSAPICTAAAHAAARRRTQHQPRSAPV